jgi:hypothetical protein
MLLPADASCEVRACYLQTEAREGVPAEDQIPITWADLERYRELYSNPGVLGELARKLMPDSSLDLETDYLEFLEAKAAGGDLNERMPIAGPRGLVTGNLRARSGLDFQVVDGVANEQRRIGRLRLWMQEFEALRSAVAAVSVSPVSEEAADTIARDQ